MASNPDAEGRGWGRGHTLKMEENIGLVIFEHLSDELNIHILDVDVLQSLVHHNNGLVELLLY
jgi:hypothetical protein